MFFCVYTQLVIVRRRLANVKNSATLPGSSSRSDDYAHIGLTAVVVTVADATACTFIRVAPLSRVRREGLSPIGHFCIFSEKAPS
jgi:hypothetical protein